ncbi:hypothetical protein LTR78_005640 [Recurvomyces mirabilis]|uniref:Carbohydrate kinase PfkB domain-containing protein n=1 Tax=Recurvomyces mirabilis TaxID=574656 RepID=A0AAE0WMP2_9PEZI|nr:hypothetical protein LTR78_005640 [Recurvomyces mirabilis]KAK5151237.1 hypothetical protein LTS14_009407 [Recurvomyces mirabilis]
MATLSWVYKLYRPRTAYHVPRTGSRRYISSNSRFFQVSGEVQQAVAERRPVVALESTIYTHGFPYPDNLSLASRLESLVRVNGGVPATIGVLDGVARVGLGADELVRLVSSAGQKTMMKISRRDLGFVCGKRGPDGQALNGGTTISATMLLAHKAGIRIFATGGLGGVHRGAQQTLDISADLTELGRTPVTVISSGCKAFLDLPKTLEYLETQGVAVATFADGRDGAVDFPAFWSRDSGVRSPMTIQDELEAARIIHAHLSLGLMSGLHFASPIPETHSIPKPQMEQAIAQALEEAHAAGAIGAASTPYILAKIKDITGSESVVANKALVEANVIRGTRVAVALRNLELDEGGHENSQIRLEKQMTGPASSNYTTTGVSKGVSNSVTDPFPANETSDTVSAIAAIEQPANIFVAGSLNVDLSCDFAPRSGTMSIVPEMHTSNPAAISQSLGGVGYNVARAAHLMGSTVRLCSAVGDDLSGRAALNALKSDGMSVTGVKTLPADNGSRTGQYVAINDGKKDLVLSMADVSILEQTQPGSDVVKAFDEFWLPQFWTAKPSYLVLDGNWPPVHLARWLEAGNQIGAHISFEPVSNIKSTGIFQLPASQTLATFPSPSINLATPNAFELAAMHTAAREARFFDRQDWWEVIDAMGIPSSGARVQMALATSSTLVDRGVPQQSIQLLPFIPSICTKLGKDGVLITQILAANDPRLTDGKYAPHILSRCSNGSEKSLGVGGVYMRLFPVIEEVPAKEVVSVNGVGDTFAGTLVAGLAKDSGKKVEDLVDLAQRAAVLTLKSKESVSPGLGTLRILL